MNDLNEDFMWEVWKFLMVILGIIIATTCVIILMETFKEKDKLISDNYEKGYVDACKDSYRGKLKYVLVENTDGTKEWKKQEGESHENKK